jgi:hypothetical protein
MGLAVYPRASFAWGVEPTHEARAETKLAWALPYKEEEDNSPGSFACACTANVPGAGMGVRDVGSGIGHRGGIGHRPKSLRQNQGKMGLCDAARTVQQALAEQSDQ